jgi:hypothetical protein
MATEGGLEANTLGPEEKLIVGVKDTVDDGLFDWTFVGMLLGK